MDVGLVARVEVSGRELVQYGRGLGDDGGRSVLHFDQRHLAEKITGPETRHANDVTGIQQLAHHQLAGVNNKHRTPRFSLRDHGGAGVEAALGEHGDQQIEARVREATEKRGGDQERFQIGGADGHRGNIPGLPAAASGLGPTERIHDKHLRLAQLPAWRMLTAEPPVLEDSGSAQ
jgi:hypothetical protein